MDEGEPPICRHVASKEARPRTVTPTCNIPNVMTSQGSSIIISEALFLGGGKILWFDANFTTEFTSNPEIPMQCHHIRDIMLGCASSQKSPSCPPPTSMTNRPDNPKVSHVRKLLWRSEPGSSQVLDCHTNCFTILATSQYSIYPTQC